MNRFEYVSPKTAAEAVSLLGEGAALKAAGTDLVARMKDRLAAPGKLVNLLQVKDLKSIAADDGGCKVGALVTLAEVAAHPGIKNMYRALAQAAGEAATPQVRNVATVGGNLCQRPRCWYFRNEGFECLKRGGSACAAQEGENQYHAIFAASPCAAVHASNLAPALVALDGKVVIRGKAERTVTAAEFFTVDDVKRENILAENEMVTGIEASPGWRSAWMEVREKQTFDWPLVGVAVAVKGADKVEAARIVLGAVAGRPWRCEAAEKALVGASLKNDAALEKVAEAALKDAKPLAKNGYKVVQARTLVVRALKTL